jgi:predicted NUDIX family NTP pyrophosphohydrolase
MAQARARIIHFDKQAAGRALQPEPPGLTTQKSEIGRLFGGIPPMTSKQSAGVLLYRQSSGIPEVFLVHPGGPFWKKKDAGVWTIPKGEFQNEEPALDAAIREFGEETGVTLKGNFQPLSPIRQKGGKKVYAWAIAGDLDPAKIVSNTFEMEWPRNSGRQISFPEIDKGAWYPLAAARLAINPAQIAFLDELEALLSSVA